LDGAKWHVKTLTAFHAPARPRTLKQSRTIPFVPCDSPMPRLHSTSRTPRPAFLLPTGHVVGGVPRDPQPTPSTLRLPASHTPPQQEGRSHTDTLVLHRLPPALWPTEPPTPRRIPVCPAEEWPIFLFFLSNRVILTCNLKSRLLTILAREHPQ